MEEVNINLFTVLERGDRKVDKIKKQAILMVGLTRAGKSCTFNWILGRDMIGVGDEI
jgi:predicted GTPase